MATREAAAAEHLAAALSALGFEGDPEMGQTPRLVAGLLAEFVPGGQAPELSTFPSAGRDLVVLRDLPFYSMCAHHLVPFFGTATVAYVPNERIIGLGAVPRLLDHLARRPQLQERLSAQLADALQAKLDPVALGIRLTTRQMCMEMRGARSQGTVETCVLRGERHDGLEAAIHRG